MKQVLIIFLLGVISFGMINYADGFIEFKRSHVTNSDKVCGDRLCNEVQEKTYQTPKNKHTPLGQFKLGIPIDEITCRQGLELVIKSSNWHPACVKSENVEKLVSLGWAVHSSELNNVFSAVKQKVTSQFEPLLEAQKVNPQTSGLGMDIQPDVIDGKLYLIFDGFGWHGFHNVEITISNDSGVNEFVMSKTGEEGHLYLPWQVPQTITAGLYNIYATDGINEFEIKIPIATP